MSDSNQDYEEYLIYIHGISQEYDKSHDEAYDNLHTGISASISRGVPKWDEWNNAKRCDVEWGWDCESEGPQAKGHRLLAEAQEKLAARLYPSIEQATDFNLNPARAIVPGARELMLKGVGDMFYYASEDGQNSVRLEVLSTILNAQGIQERLQNDRPFSITLFGHSAGSVIAFDFLLYLFANGEDGQQTRSNEASKKFSFINFEAPSVKNSKLNLLRGGESLKSNLEKFRDMAQNGKVRVRRLVTFGSPISQLVFRSDRFLEILAKGDRLNASQFGLDRNPEVFGEPLEGPRWINLWDKDDILAWPVEPLVQEEDTNVVADIYTNVSSLISNAHNLYWDSKIVHEQIAKHW